MPDCNYCDRSFDVEDRYHEHLAAEHEGELSRIDRRRIGTDGDEKSGFPTGPVVLVGVIGIGIVLVGYIVVLAGGNGSDSGVVKGIQVEQMPGSLSQSAHAHGEINVTIGGEQPDFSRDRFQVQSDPFHFERGNGEIWHVHADGVTLQFAMATLGINVTETTVTYQGETYRDSDPNTTVRVLVDGEPVDPATYVLQGSRERASQGDFVKILAFREG